MAVSRPTKEQMTILSGWVVEALELMPYMSHILFSLRPFNSNKTKSFACDDKHRLYINFDHVTQEFTHRLSAEALLHECAHLFSDDMGRSVEVGVKQTKEGYAKWNSAADLANNDDLVDAGCIQLGEYGLTPQSYGFEPYRTAEEYYELLKNQPQKPQKGPKSESSDGGDEAGDGSGSDGDDDDADDGDEACGSASGNRSDAEDDDTGDPGVDTIGKELTRITTAGEIRKYAEQYPGSVPGRLLADAEMILAAPAVSWRRLLSAQIRRTVASRKGHQIVTYKRRNRRRPSFNNIVLPGRLSPTPSIVVVRDTSMSMDAELFTEASSEIVGIAKQLGVRGEQLIILDVDTEVAAKVKYRQKSDLFTRAGNGGTNMGAGIEYARTLNPTTIVVITDGYSPWPSEGGVIPVVVCVVGSDEVSGLPDWAKIIYVNDKKKDSV